MNKKRLQKLADFLKGVQDEKFDLGTFVSEDMGYYEEDIIHQLKDIKCGTTACAVGWMPVIWPKTFTYTEGQEVCFRKKKMEDSDWSESKMVSMEWFDLTSDQWDSLFLSRGYEWGYDGVPKASVIAKIERSITTNKVTYDEF